MTTEDLLKRIEALETALYGPFDNRLRVQERFLHGVAGAAHGSGSPSWPPVVTGGLVGIRSTEQAN
jgi:hypothetical protein